MWTFETLFSGVSFIRPPTNGILVCLDLLVRQDHCVHSVTDTDLTPASQANRLAWETFPECTVTFYRVDKKFKRSFSITCNNASSFEKWVNICQEITWKKDFINNWWISMHHVRMANWDLNFTCTFMFQTDS